MDARDSYKALKINRLLWPLLNKVGVLTDGEKAILLDLQSLLDKGYTLTDKQLGMVKNLKIKYGVWK